MSKETRWVVPDHHIEEGGWQKPVAPPVATAVPPPGMPPVSAAAQPVPVPPSKADQRD
jgi:hypothetical protein